MKLAITALFASVLAAPLSTAAPGFGLRDYIIVFERGLETPDSVIKGVADTLKNVGAQINYEYHTVIKGFSVSIPPNAVDTIKNANSAEYPFVLEEDQEMHAL